MDLINKHLQKEGGDFLKGGSAIPALKIFENEMQKFLRENLRDSSGALIEVLSQRIKDQSEMYQHQFKEPSTATLEFLKKQIAENSIVELVRQCDQIWGRTYGERPHFDKPGQEPHPDDEYTIDSVRQSIETVLGLFK